MIAQQFGLAPGLLGYLSKQTFQMQFEQIHNSVGRMRRATLDGRTYLVTPVSMIVPGVLPGSKGPLLYRPEDIKASLKGWNGIPLTLDHPYDPLTNEHLSSQSPGVIARQGIGTLRNVSFRDKLRGEAWIDEERAKKVAPQVIDAIKNGRTMEVSTGLYTNNVPVPDGSSHIGRPYSHIATEFQPDHLAILPIDTVGACSINDGCGLNVNSNPVQNVTDSQLDKLAALGDEFEHDYFLDGYGQIYFCRSNGTVWYTSSDGTTEDECDEIEIKLSELPFVKDVWIEAEAGPPRDDTTWVKVWPKPTDNANPEGHNQYTSGNSDESEKPADPTPKRISFKERKAQQAVRLADKVARGVPLAGKTAEAAAKLGTQPERTPATVPAKAEKEPTKPVLPSQSSTSGKQPSTAQGSGPTKVLTSEHVLQAVKDVGGKSNHANLADVREHHLLKDHSRYIQDKAIHQARREGKVTAGAMEGRFGSTERERVAAIPDDEDRKLGHLMVRNSSPDPCELRNVRLEALERWLVTNDNPEGHNQYSGRGGLLSRLFSGKKTSTKLKEESSSATQPKEQTKEEKESAVRAKAKSDVLTVTSKFDDVEQHGPNSSIPNGDGRFITLKPDTFGHHDAVTIGFSRGHSNYDEKGAELQSGTMSLMRKLGKVLDGLKDIGTRASYTAEPQRAAFNDKMFRKRGWTQEHAEIGADKTGYFVWKPPAKSDAVNNDVHDVSQETGWYIDMVTNANPRHDAQQRDSAGQFATAGSGKGSGPTHEAAQSGHETLKTDAARHDTSTILKKQTDKISQSQQGGQGKQGSSQHGQGGGEGFTQASDDPNTPSNTQLSADDKEDAELKAEARMRTLQAYNTHMQTSNFNPKGINQYTGRSGSQKDAESVSSSALKSSEKAQTQLPYGIAAKAFLAAANGDSDTAEKHHEDAAKTHDKLAEKYSKTNPEVSKLHKYAADHHRVAMDAHKEVTGNSQTSNRFISQDTRDKMPDEDFAGPDNSFPIKTQADVDAAVSSIGRTKHDPEVIKAGIKRIAKRKGLTLPDSWQDDATENQEASSPTDNEHERDVTTRNSSLPGNREIAPPAVPNQPLTGDSVDPVDMSKQAAGATVLCKPGKATDHAMTATQAAHDSDPDAASDAHAKAALAHDRQATKARVGGDDDEADMNHQAADMHRRAGAIHQASMVENELETGEIGDQVGIENIEDGLKELNRLLTNGKQTEGCRKITEYVANFNPFHDEKGQFTSGGSSGAAKGAKNASDKAMKTGKAGDHQKAANALHALAAHHLKNGNTKQAEGALYIGNKHGAQAKAKEASDKAATASKDAAEANRTRSGGEIQSAHDAAASAHKSASKANARAGNKDMVDLHNKFAAHHDSKGTPDLSEFTGNRKDGGQTMNKKKLIGKLVANGCACQADVPHLNRLSKSALSLIANAPMMRGGGGRQQDDDENDDEDDDEDEGDDSEMERNEDNDDHSFDQATPQRGSVMQAGGKGVESEYSENSKKSQIRRSMTPQEQEVWNTAQQTWHQQKLAVVRQLVANVKDDAERKALGMEYMQKPIGELHKILKLFPPQQAHNRFEQPAYSEPLYEGAAGGGGMVGNADSDGDNTDVLDVPTMNFAEWAKEDQARTGKRRAN